MSSIAAHPRLASAAAVFFGRHGDVSALARQRGVFRQTLYREAYAAHAALADQPDPQASDLCRCLAEQQQSRPAQIRRGAAATTREGSATM